MQQMIDRGEDLASNAQSYLFKMFLTKNISFNKSVKFVTTLEIYYKFISFLYYKYVIGGQYLKDTETYENGIL